MRAVVLLFCLITSINSFSYGNHPRFKQKRDIVQKQEETFKSLFKFWNRDYQILNSVNSLITQERLSPSNINEVSVIVEKVMRENFEKRREQLTDTNNVNDSVTYKLPLSTYRVDLVHKIKSLGEKGYRYVKDFKKDYFRYYINAEYETEIDRELESLYSSDSVLDYLKKKQKTLMKERKLKKLEPFYKHMYLNYVGLYSKEHCSKGRSYEECFKTLSKDVKSKSLKKFYKDWAEVATWSGAGLTLAYLIGPVGLTVAGAYTIWAIAIASSI